MATECQDSLAWQQNINCFQLAEFPPLSRGLGQSKGSLVKTEHVHRGNCSTVPLLTDSTTKHPLCLHQMDKITHTSDPLQSMR